MRYLIGSQMSLLAVPFIFVVGAAYVWVMERVLGKKPAMTTTLEQTTRETRAA
jgi:hypothetical protein